ncbi:hypothetical protein Bhyg_12343 [Pseudolycoriella hygida]|uniref:Uncharacterized protein n=1 Tax=Pseudolycoriella hygida TaxID=35572 RepID=A0A9Q0MX17_9DIPT|nr:hypothetical protein Bhyg_12343 [Pseudolycoriella hygida]
MTKRCASIKSVKCSVVIRTKELFKRKCEINWDDTLSFDTLVSFVLSPMFIIFLPIDLIKPAYLHTANLLTLSGNSSVFSLSSSPESFGIHINLTYAYVLGGGASKARNAERGQKLAFLSVNGTFNHQSSAIEKGKLINVLIINQQLDVINPPEVGQSEPVEEPRTIKSILKPPAMPQRVKPKRNMNLKNLIWDREAADRHQEIVREEEEIAKHSRENEIAAVNDELKRVRRLVGDARWENMSINKEIAPRKKDKVIDSAELGVQEEAKKEREQVIKQYDDQLRELRDKFKKLKSEHMAANKAMLLKRKAYELEKNKKATKSNHPLLNLRSISMLIPLCQWYHNDKTDKQGYTRLNFRQYAPFKVNGQFNHLNNVKNQISLKIKRFRSNFIRLKVNRSKSKKSYSMQKPDDVDGFLKPFVEEFIELKDGFKLDETARHDNIY